ncbi:MAG: hypothetical protein ACYCTI_06790 [Acidimicrobiales bacterium]
MLEADGLPMAVSTPQTSCVYLDRTRLLEGEEAFAVGIAKPVSALSAHGVRGHLYRAQGRSVEMDAVQRMIERLARPPAPKPPARRLVR